MSLNFDSYSADFVRNKFSSRIDVSLTFDPLTDVTKQEFKDECDINVILARYASTGEIPNLNERAPNYFDCTGADYQAHMNFIIHAQGLFNDLPSSLRNRFNNDPAQFLDFCSDASNTDEMRKLGLLKPVPEAVVPAAVVDPSPAPVEPV